MSKNRKHVHDIKGKMSVITTLVQLLEMKEEGLDEPEKLDHLINKMLNSAKTQLPEILELLDKIE